MLAFALTTILGLSTDAADPPRTPTAFKVLFLGNSITKHGPKPDIGWTGNWGMAASTQEKDYVHLLLSRLKNSAKGELKPMVRNIADFERSYEKYDVAMSLKEALEFKPDLVIIAIGENVSGLTTDAARENFRVAFEKLLTSLQGERRPRIIVRSTFWTNAAKNEAMAAAAKSVGATFVDLNGLDKDEKNFARSEQKFDHAGVAAHPGDKGMEAIADAIWKAIEKRAEEIKR